MKIFCRGSAAFTGLQSKCVVLANITVEMLSCSERRDEKETWSLTKSLLINLSRRIVKRKVEFVLFVITMNCNEQQHLEIELLVMDLCCDC